MGLPTNEDASRAVASAREIAERVLELGCEPTADLAMSLHELMGAVGAAWMAIRQTLPPDEVDRLNRFELALQSAARARGPGDEDTRQ
jgi:hypothetical protein